MEPIYYDPIIDIVVDVVYLILSPVYLASQLFIIENAITNELPSNLYEFLVSVTSNKYRSISCYR